MPLRPTSPHGGDGWHLPEGAVLDVSANLHPLGPPPGVLDACRAALLGGVGVYPPPYAEPLRDALSARLGVQIGVGNGATELLVAAFRGARRVRLFAPCYGGYAEAARVAGVSYGYEGEGDVCVVGRPNNPDGSLPSLEFIRALTQRWERVVVDESFLGFLDEPSCVGLANNLVVITSMTKTYAIPGLRLGWAWGLPHQALTPWSVNAVAMAAGLACVQAWDWPRQIPLADWRDALARGLARWGEVDGQANFLRVRLARQTGVWVREKLFAHGILIRDGATIPGCGAAHIRVAVRRPVENMRVLEALTDVLG